MLSIRTGFFAAAASAAVLTAPVAPASAAPIGLAPGSIVRTESPVEQVRYRRHVVRHGYYVQRPRHVTRQRHYGRRYYRPYRYGYNPGLAIAGAVLGGVAAAGAYGAYGGYDYPAYSYPAYPAYGYGYSSPYYGWGGGWGGRRVYHGGWGW